MPKSNYILVIFLIVTVAVGIIYFKNSTKETSLKAVAQERVVTKLIKKNINNLPLEIPLLKEVPEYFNAENVSNSQVVLPQTPVTDNDDVFAAIKNRADFYDEFVIPKMNSLSSTACKIICHPTVYDQKHVFQNPDYEKNFFVVDPEAALEDPEFRLSAEIMLNASKVDHKASRDEIYNAQLEMFRNPDDGMLMKKYLDLESRQMERRREHRTKYNEISELYRKYREIRTQCNSESPSLLERQCYQLLGPNGHFPRL